MVFGLVYRIYKIASSMTIFHQDVGRFTESLIKNGFPRDFIESCVNAVLMKYHAPGIQQMGIPTVPKKELKMFLPFLGPMSDQLKKTIVSHVSRFYPGIDLKIIYRRGKKLQSFFNYKDTFPLACKSGVVYYSKCEKCGPSVAYMGKTINSLYERFHQPGMGHLNSTNTSSAFLRHIVETNDPDCKFVFENVKILEACKYDEQLRFIESILLKYEKQTLNT